MNLKTSLLGLLMYGAMAAYLAAFVAGRKRSGPMSRRLFAAGFIFAALALAYRGASTGHWPLKNLFEVFLAMGALVWPAGYLARRLPVPGERLDPLLGFVVLWPAGFVFAETPRALPPALQSPLFVPHVLVYLGAYLLLTKAAAVAALQFSPCEADRRDEIDRSALALASWGFPLLTLGLLLGAWWGKLAWGDYWHWDPKEMWALATWLIYAGYFHARSVRGRGPSRLYAGLLLAGFAAIILTLSWVNLSRLFAGLHSYAM
jgi:ABC-type transport system involved in cytochrome c biogenesis permease subunit